MKRNSGWLLLTVACMVFLLEMALPAIPVQAQSFAYVTSSSNLSRRSTRRATP